jgi:hypothetical protein
MTDFRSVPHDPPDAPQDAVPEQAARLASDVSEARSEQQRRRLLAPFTAASRSAASVAGATREAGRSAGKSAAALVEATRSAGKSVAGATRDAALSAARATGRGVRATGRAGRSARRGVSGGSGWLAGQVLTMATRLRVRDQAALRAQFPGRSAEEIADALVEGAARASAAVGGAVGAWAALPVLPAFPAEIATETLALVGIEIKLVAELHEAYGVPAEGNAVERMTAYVGAWANRRGVALVPGGLILVANSPLARRLRWRLATRAGRTAFSLAPLLTGAAAGAMLNRRETRKLGQDVRRDLRGRVQDPSWRSSPGPSAALSSTVLDQPES